MTLGQIEAHGADELKRIRQYRALGATTLSSRNTPFRLPELQPLNKLIERSIGLLWRLLLHPVTGAVDEGRAAIIEAVRPRVFIQIRAGYEVPDSISASSDKAAWLSQLFTVKRWQCQRIKCLGSIAVRGAHHPAFFECFDIQRPVAFLHPIRERVRVY